MATISRSTIDPNANHNVEIALVTSILAALSTLIVVARLWSTKITARGFGFDDVLLFAGWTCAMGVNSLTLLSMHYARFGYHITSLNPAQLVVFQKLVFSESLILPTALALAKLSILVFFHRVFTVSAFRYTIRGLGALVMAWWLAAEFGALFICRPVRAHWDPSVPANCGNQRALDYGTPIPWIMTDFAILISPLPVLKSLQISSSQKIGLYFLFLVGILTCIVSCVRYSTVFFSLTDPTWDIVPPALWSVAEANITIICAGVTASRPAFALFYPTKLILSAQAYWPSFLSSRSNTRSHINITEDSNVHGIETPFKDMPVHYTQHRGIIKSQEYSVGYSDRTDASGFKTADTF